MQQHLEDSLISRIFRSSPRPIIEEPRNVRARDGFVAVVDGTSGLLLCEDGQVKVPSILKKRAVSRNARHENAGMRSKPGVQMCLRQSFAPFLHFGLNRYDLRCGENSFKGGVIPPTLVKTNP